MPSPKRLTLSLLPLLALAVVLALVSISQPAQAQEPTVTVWQTSLKVDADKGNAYYGCGNEAGLRGCKSSNAFGDGRSFKVGGTKYQVNELVYTPSFETLELGLVGLSGSETKTRLAGMTLHVQSTRRDGVTKAFLVNDATTKTDAIYWGSADLFWGQDELVILQLKRPIPPTTETPAPDKVLKTALVGDAHDGPVCRFLWLQQQVHRLGPTAPRARPSTGSNGFKLGTTRPTRSRPSVWMATRTSR